jgi:MtN3 and saliva related transmembrane protein
LVAEAAVSGYFAEPASVGFVVYSWLLGNWVFVVTNALMLCTALLGQWIYVSNSDAAEA